MTLNVVENDSPLDEDDEFEFSFNYNDIESAKRKPGQLMCSAKRVKRGASVSKEPVEALEEGFCEKQVGIEDNESVEGEGQKKVDSPRLATTSAVV